MCMLTPMNLIILGNYVYVDPTGFWMLVNYVLSLLGFWMLANYVYADINGFYNACKLGICYSNESNTCILCIC